MSKSCYLTLFFRDFYKMLENLCTEWILWKMLRNGENLIWKYFENFLAFRISCKVTKKILKRRGCNFRETLQKFSGNFEKIFKYKKRWNNVNVKEILVTNIHEILRKLSKNWEVLEKFWRHLRNISLKFFFFFLALATWWALCRTVRNYKEWMILRRDKKWITRWL